MTANGKKFNTNSRNHRHSSREGTAGIVHSQVPHIHQSSCCVTHLWSIRAPTDTSGDRGLSSLKNTLDHWNTISEIEISCNFCPLVHNAPLFTAQGETNPLFHLFNRYLVSIRCMPGVILGARERAVNKTDPNPHIQGTYIPVEEDGKQNKNLCRWIW